jgi:hypothetical protein
METALSILAGGILTIFSSLWVELIRRPKLKLTISTPSDHHYDSHPAGEARFLLVDVFNEPTFRLLPPRNVATQCRATVTFHHLDGQDVLGRVLTARWRSSPEPVGINGQIENGPAIKIFDPTRFELIPQVSIAPGEPAQAFTVAAKFDNDEECYGWSNENYFSNPQWRHPKWRLPKGRYLVIVTVHSAGVYRRAVFRLLNDVERRDFRLEPASREDEVNLHRWHR